MNHSQQGFSQPEGRLLDACIVADTGQHSIASLYAKLTDVVAWKQLSLMNWRGPSRIGLFLSLDPRKSRHTLAFSCKQTQARIEEFHGGNGPHWCAIQ